MIGPVTLALLGPLLSAQDLPTQALAVLEKRCARCHTPGGESTKAERFWADAMDVPAAIEEALVIPGEPADSDLWLVVEEGSMPPEDSPEFPMPAAEAEVLRSWIAQGALLPAESLSPEENGDQVDQGNSVPGVEKSDSGSAAFPVPEPKQGGAVIDTGSPVGRLHPLAVHFPVALLLVAALAELICLLRLGKLHVVVRFSLWLGVLGAFVASWLGWSLADLQPRAGSSGDLQEQHRWYGVATLAVAALSLLAVELRARSTRPGLLARLAPIAILLGALLVSWTGHLGGGLSRGPSWLNDALPAPVLELIEWCEERLP